MKALVAVKRVPDGNVPIRIKPDGSSIDLAGMPMCINPFDAAALEQAVQWKENGQIHEILAVSIGNPHCEETLRHALALGADRAIRIEDDSQPEPLAIARQLQALIARESPDLVLLGKQSSDTGCAQVGPMLAALLDWPLGTFVSAMSLADNQLTVTCEIEGGQEMHLLPLPAVLTADLRLATPRYLKLPQLLQAKKKPVETLQATSLAAPAARAVETLLVSPPPPRRPARHTRDPKALLDWLCEEGLLGEGKASPAHIAPDRPTTGHVLILAEHDGEHLHVSTERMAHAARQLGAQISVLVAGNGVETIATEAAAVTGVTRVLLADAPHLERQPDTDLAPLLAQCAHEWNVSALMAATSPLGKTILPRTAALLGCAMCSDIVAIPNPDTLVGPIHAGQALASWHSLSTPLLFTARPSSFARAGRQAAAPIHVLAIPPARHKARWLSLLRPENVRPELANARIVISGGGGLQSADKFRTLLEPLADRLGAAIGATLSAVNAGFADNSLQVGQTGVTIAPEFYFAIGLSGAAQHLAGMRDSRIIIAINKDREAPICRHADYVLEGDLFELVPELIRLLEG